MEEMNELPPPDMTPGDNGDMAVGHETLSFDDLPDPSDPGQVAHNRRAGDKPGSLDAVLDVPVRVRAVLGRARMQISELVSMRPGYVVDLDRRVGEPIDILVNDRLIARGEIVMIDGVLGVTLTEIVREEK